MRLKISVFVFILLSIKLTAYCQKPVNISGRVISLTDKLPIPNVSISSLGKNAATVTNEEGKFTLVAAFNQADSLLVTSIGYKPQKIALFKIKLTDQITIELDTLIQQLKEVTIRPLTLKQLLDSILLHNTLTFLSPMKLNGYYREFVFTNTKCTEYSDALCSYYNMPNGKSPTDGQLKIIASRCVKAKSITGVPNQEYYLESIVNPNQAFQYAMLAEMIKKYLPDEDLAKYDYTIEQSSEKLADLVITIAPKSVTTDKIYKVVFNVSDDFTIVSYKLEIPSDRLQFTPAKSLLGIHVRLMKNLIEVNYEHSGNGIYPSFYQITRSVHIWGKFLGHNIEQTDEFKSAYVTTDINTTDLKPFQRSEIYKKGNICNNGAAMNDALLMEHNFIQPTKKDSLAIQSLNSN